MIVAAALGPASVRHYTVGTYIVTSTHDGDESGHSVAVDSHRGDVAVGLLAGELDIDLWMPFLHRFKQLRQAPVGVGPGNDVHFAGIQQGVFQALRHTSENAYYQFRL